MHTFSTVRLSRSSTIPYWQVLAMLQKLPL